LDLGHVKGINRVVRSGDRVFSRDYDGRWILWDAASGNALATGSTDASSFLGIAGDLAVVQTASGVLLHDATIGQLQATLPIASSSISKLGLATDGSYLWVALGTTGHLQAFSPTGVQLIDVAGGYASAIVFAAPMELRVAGGPAGLNKVETIPISGGASTLSPAFNHALTHWMLDGERLLAVAGNNTVFVYEKDATLVGGFTVASLENIGGSGDYFWTFDQYISPYTVNIYKVTAGNTPVYTKSNAYGSGGHFAVSRTALAFAGYADASIDVILLGSSLGFASKPVSTPYLTALSIDDGGLLSAGNNKGAVYEVGTKADPLQEGPLGCGQVLASAGSAGRAVVSTASSRILAFDVTGGTTTLAKSWLMSPTPSRLALTTDGSLLGALPFGGYPPGYPGDKTLHLLEFPGLVEINAFPDTRDLSLALSGTRVGRSIYPSGRAVTSTAGNTVVWSDTSQTPTPFVSPSGASFAVSDQPPIAVPWVSTQIYDGSTLVNAVSGYAVGWIDDGRLLIQTYKDGPPPFEATPVYDSSFIYDAQGNLLTTPPLPRITDFDVVAPGKILSHYDGKIYDVQTGGVVWSNPVAGAASGVEAGGSVVFAYQRGVYVVPHP
jgi:hypothetical protein